MNPLHLVALAAGVWAGGATLLGFVVETAPTSPSPTFEIGVLSGTPRDGSYFT